MEKEVNFLDDKNFKIYITPDMEIKDLKPIIKDKEGSPVDNKKFIFAGKQNARL